MPRKSKYAGIDPEYIDELSNKVKQIYIVDNRSKEETMKILDIDLGLLRYIIDLNDFRKDQKARLECRKRTNLARYGNTCSMHGKAQREKKKQTWIEHYGVDNPSKADAIKQQKSDTCMEHYGVACHLQSDEIKEQIRQTNLEKYGVDNYNKSRVNSYARSIMYDKDKFIDFIMKYDYNDRTVKRLSEDLGVSRATIGRRSEEYKITDLINVFPAVSSYEYEIQDLLRSKGIDTELSNYSVLGNREIDIYSNYYKVGIEFNGVYWHSAIFKSADYHQKKSLLAMKKGVFIYHIFEYEWNNPRQHDIIVSQLLNLFNKDTTRIYARKCEVREVSASESRKFLNENHIQGYRNARYKYGLYYNDELVSIMTFSQDKFILKGNITEKTYELVRFCSKLGYSVVGGASKLFKHFIDDIQPDTIISYCDIAKGRGTTYEKLGFKLDKITSCNYKWISFDGLDIKSRYQCQPRFIREGPDDKRTEIEIMESRGYDMVFDCGSYKFIWNREEI